MADSNFQGLIVQEAPETRSDRNTPTRSADSAVTPDGQYRLPSRLTDYLQARVTVHYTTGYADTGQVTYLDTTWVELVKDNRERLLIPLVAVRLLKLLETAHPEGDAAWLLRPSEGEKKQR